jgi:hypothetical protein
MVEEGAEKLLQGEQIPSVAKAAPFQNNDFFSTPYAAEFRY